SSHEFFKARANFVPYPAEDSQARGFVAFSGGGIVKAPVNPLGLAGKYRAAFLGAVAHGENVVKRLPAEFVRRLRAMTGDIDADLPHRLNRQGVHAGGDGAGAENVDAVAGHF